MGFLSNLSKPIPMFQKKAKKPTDEPTETNTDQPAKETVAVVTEKEAAVVKEEEVAVVIEGAAAVEKVAEKAVAEKALVQEKAVVAQAVVEQVAEAPRNLLSPVVGWVSGIFSPQSIPASTPAAAQQVQAAEFSTMVSHQVPCFVEAGEVVEAGKEAEAALPGFLSMPPVRAPTLVDSVVGWVSGVFTAKEKLPASFLESALPTKTEFEASLLLPDIERAKLERDTKAAAETIKAVTLAKAEAAGARAGEAAAATAMQAAVRGHGARSSMAAAADAETESYINEVVAGVVASAIDTVSEAEKAAAKAPKPNLLTRLSTMSSSLFAKKTKKAAEGEAEVEVETDKRKSFSPFKKSKKATADVEEQQPVIKFGFKVSESGEVTIDMELEKAARAVA